jgi:hypothetical protein
MAKTQALDGTDLTPVKPHSQSATRQRGVVPSAELVPMQFKMPREFVRAFKVTAASNDMKCEHWQMPESPRAGSTGPYTALIDCPS